MYLSELLLENFRIFGTDNNRGVVQFAKGVTAIVGGNDHGKTAVMDGIRLALGTTDSDFTRVSISDFHSRPSGTHATTSEFRIRCKFDELTVAERGAFTEFLTYENRESENRKFRPVLYLNFIAKSHEKRRQGRPFITTEIKSGCEADGIAFDQVARSLLAVTYLKPLRDAEREMSAGRGSRLSQILLNSKSIDREGSVKYDKDSPPKSIEEIEKLSVLGLGDYANDLLSNHEAILGSKNNLNKTYLDPLSFSGEHKSAGISIGGSGDEKNRLRQLLEKLELQFDDSANSTVRHGLGSNNLMYMACELLLLGDETDTSPLLLIEEPEAHLHPQRQLLLTQFLKKQAEDENKNIQVILTTHSPNISSALPLDSLILMQKGKAYSLAKGKTKLHENDYRFLQRFLEVTKANLFFARGVAIVEGDAENILLPKLSELIGRDFAKHGVSIINVGTVGLGRYAKILMRSNESEEELGVPVACITDLDVMPDCAPEILAIEEKPGRRWKKKSDFDPPEKLEEHRAEKAEKISGQGVNTFVSDEWTLEYDLAFSGLAEEVYVASQLAKQDEQICESKTTADQVKTKARVSFAGLPNDSSEILASYIYSEFARKSGTKASKSIAAQYLVELLEDKKLSPETWEKILPSYLVSAIKHVTQTSSGKKVSNV